MTAGDLIKEMKKLLNEFNEKNQVDIERIEVECEKEEKRTLAGNRNIDYQFHMTFSD